LLGVGCGGYQKTDTIHKTDIIHNSPDYCSDHKYDNDLRCVANPESELKKMINSVYEVRTEITYITHSDNDDDGKNEIPIHSTLSDSILGGSGTLFKGNYMLTADHSVNAEKKVRKLSKRSKLKVELRSSRSYILYKGEKYDLEKIVSNGERGFDYAWMRVKGLSENAPVADFNFGTNYDLNQGDFTYLIGNNDGGGINVTSGEVSRIKLGDRESKLKDNYFVISNPPCPGNSGCPVFGVRDGRFEILGIVVRGKLVEHIIYITKIDKILSDALMRLHTEDLYQKHPILSNMLLRVYDKK